jgi:hypothetical protein
VLRLAVRLLLAALVLPVLVLRVRRLVRVVMASVGSHLLLPGTLTKTQQKAITDLVVIARCTSLSSAEWMSAAIKAAAPPPSTKAGSCKTPAIRSMQSWPAPSATRGLDVARAAWKPRSGCLGMEADSEGLDPLVARLPVMRQLRRKTTAQLNPTLV